LARGSRGNNLLHHESGLLAWQKISISREFLMASRAKLMIFCFLLPTYSSELKEVFVQEDIKL
jgi:hypothetical protein